MKKLFSFLKESWEELKKVTWPTKDESIHTAVIVVIFVVVFSLFLFFVDTILQRFVMWMVG